MNIFYKARLGFIFIILFFSIGCLTSTKKLNFYSEGGGSKESVSVKRELSIIELSQLYKSLELIKLIDPSQSYVNYEKIPVYWMDSRKFAGLTVWNRNDELLGIFLDISLKIKNPKDNFEYLYLGSIYSHELSHALHNTKDPHTSTITEGRIFNLISNNTNVINLVKIWNPF